MVHCYNTRFQAKKVTEVQAQLQGKPQAQQQQAQQPQEKETLQQLVQQEQEKAKQYLQERVHRYNTRFQLKKAAEKEKQQQQQQQQKQPSLFVLCDVRSPPTTEDKEKWKPVMNLLTAAMTQTDPYKKVFNALRLFHYLENNTHFMRMNLRFRAVLKTKATEFIEVSKTRSRDIQNMPSGSAAYEKAHHLALATEYLAESCSRILCTINEIIC